MFPNAFTRLASTSTINKTSVGGAVAFSPMEALIAEAGWVKNENKSSQSGNTEHYFVYITNYETQAAIGKMPIKFRPHTLAFSPNGSLLLAMPGGKGNWDDICIYSNPWQSSADLEIEAVYGLFHGAWIDNTTILFAGKGPDQTLRIASLNVESQELRTLYLESVKEETSFYTDIDNAFCSRSGLVAFSIGYGRQIKTFQLINNNVVPANVFEGAYNGNGVEVAIAEDGQTIICMPRYDGRLTLFDRAGKQLGFITNTSEGVYRSGVLASKHNTRYGSKLQIYQIRNNAFHLWSEDSSTDQGANGLDIIVRDGKTLIAVENRDHTDVFELEDFDVLRLSSKDAKERIEAIESIGNRGLKSAMPWLTRLLWDESLDVQRRVLQELQNMFDPAALPQLIRRLGDKPNDQTLELSPKTVDDSINELSPHPVVENLTSTEIVSALQSFPIKDITTATLDCINRSQRAYRRGAAKLLDSMQSIEALEALCQALSDVDIDVKQLAAHALEKRKDIGAAVFLFGYLNDDLDDFRLAVQKALIAILEAEGFLSSEVLLYLTEPLDISAYAGEVIDNARMQEFENFGNLHVRHLLNSLASACVEKQDSLAEILNSIEKLILPRKQFRERLANSIALTIALIIADKLRKKQKWSEAVDIYRKCLILSKTALAPQIEWRAWHAIGNCLEALGNDRQALHAFGSAMEIIDSVWFDLLEESKLQDFFQDKALLYDDSILCALRLGHYALSLEYGEKAKTRYLGDLIARRQINPRVALDQELTQFWATVNEARPVRVPLSTLQTSGAGLVEIVAVKFAASDNRASFIKPKYLAEYEKMSNVHEQLKNSSNMIQSIWDLIAYCSTHEDELIAEHLENIYEALLPIYQLVKSESTPLSVAEQEQYLRQYKNAATELANLNWVDNEYRLSAATGIPDSISTEQPKYWAFREFGTDWIESILNTKLINDEALVLDVVMEAINLILHHAPVFGVPDDPSEDQEDEQLLFVSRSLEIPSDSLSEQTTVINTALAQHTKTTWRYLTQIVRGDTVVYSDISKTLTQSKVAQLQFAVTEQGTIVYVIYGGEDRSETTRIPYLRGKENLKIHSIPEITLSYLKQYLTDKDYGWFALYGHLRTDDELQSWMNAIDRTFEWLYSRLIAPLIGELRARGVKHLRIVPHRALHLIPFSAMYHKSLTGKRHYLIDSYTIEYAPSATLQQICRDRAKKLHLNHSLTAISNPTNDLPFADAEIREIRSQFVSSNVEVLSSDDASLTQLMSIVPKSIFHFSGHAKYLPRDPLSSYMRLAGKDKLSLEDLFSESLPLLQTHLVVLSACETNLTSQDDLVDEYIGLASGFLFAGAPAIISTLWRVDDIATYLLITHFYKQYLQGKRPSEALKIAQIWLRDKVDRRFVVKTIQSLLDKLEKQDMQVTEKERFYLTNQKEQLSEDLQRAELAMKKNPRGRPFEHPFYWAAFTLTGIDNS